MKDRSETYLVHLSEDDKATYLPNHVPSVLTPREREVLEVIAEGHGSKAAGERLYISKRTVDFHLAAAYHKLGVNNRVQAIKVATRRGLIPQDRKDS